MIPKWIYLLMMDERARTRNCREENLEGKSEDCSGIKLVSPGYMEKQQKSASDSPTYS